MALMVYAPPSSRSFWLKLGSLLTVFALLWTSVSLSQTALNFVEATPPDQATNVEREQVFQISFDQPLPDVNALAVTGQAEDPSYTIQVGQDNVVQVQSSPAPQPQLAFDIRGEQLLLQPTEPLLYSTNYSLSVPAQESLPLAADLQLTFKTVPEYTYEQDVQPLLDAACVGCHRFEGSQRNSPMDTYAGVMAFVQPGQESSPLLDPQWTTRHGSQFDNSTSSGNQPSQPSQFTTGSGSTFTDAGGGASFRSGRSSALAYIRRPPDANKGPSELYTPEQLGAWTPEQVQLIATWVIRDDAAESLEAQP